MLSPYRVLDLSDERGQLAGFVLAQLGADPGEGCLPQLRRTLADDASELEARAETARHVAMAGKKLLRSEKWSTIKEREWGRPMFASQ